MSRIDPGFRFPPPPPPPKPRHTLAGTVTGRLSIAILVGLLYMVAKSVGWL